MKRNNMLMSRAYGIYLIQHSSQFSFCFWISNLLKEMRLFTPIPTVYFSFPQKMCYIRSGSYFYIKISVTKTAVLNFLLFLLNEKWKVNAQLFNKQEVKFCCTVPTHQPMKYMKLSSHPLFKQDPHNAFT